MLNPLTQYLTVAADNHNMLFYGVALIKLPEKGCLKMCIFTTMSLMQGIKYLNSWYKDFFVIILIILKL